MVFISVVAQSIDSNFDAILVELLRDMGGRLWRNREAACYATADLLQACADWPAALDALTQCKLLHHRAYLGRPISSNSSLSVH